MTNKFPGINGLHHFAWKCRDIDETRDFYEDILGLPLVQTIENDFVPSTGEFSPSKHVFFQFKDGSCITFFDLGDGLGARTDADEWVVHFAMGVDTEDDLLVAKEKLVANGIEVLGPIDHEDIKLKSIYFFDPNGLRLELSCDLTSKQA